MNLYDCQQKLITMIEPGHDGNNPGAHQLIKKTGKLSPGKRIDIYRRSITSGQQRTLQLVFPVCQAILGDACFNTLARDYTWDNRSDCDDLNHYGHLFPEFIDEITNTLSAFADYAYLGDLSRLEWLWHHCHFAKNTPDHKRLNFNHLNVIKTGLVWLKTIPALQRFDTPWPVYAIWLNHHSGNNSGTEMPASLEQLVIWRQNDLVKIGKLEPPVDELLPILEKGCTISHLADKSSMNYQQLHEHLLWMTAKGWLMFQTKDSAHVQ